MAGGSCYGGARSPAVTPVDERCLGRAPAYERLKMAGSSVPGVDLGQSMALWPRLPN